MSRYLYITDVYCPWCYAFGLVFDKVLARYPMPVSVLCGELVSPGYTIDDMVMEMPNIRAFFKRLQDTAGRGVGKAYLDLLEPGKGSMSMDSRAMSVPVAALRRLDPGKEREQIEALQKAFYQDGQDVLDPYVQARACGVDEEALILECSRKEVQEQAEKDRQRAVDILGDFVIYPTLFLERDSGERVLLARSFTDLGTVLTRLEMALEGSSKTDASGKEASAQAASEGHGHGCGPNGCTL